MQPQVTCVLLTGLPGRRRMANFAIEAFRRQTYDRRDLLILNTAGDGSWLAGGDDGGRIRELHFPGNTPRWALRNLGIEHATGEYVLQWDDDDFYGPQRIERQVAALHLAPVSILKHELVHFLGDGTSVAVSAAKWTGGGFPGTILHPQGVQARYPEEFYEDTFFLKQLLRETKVHALHNDVRDYVRLCHGGNVCGEDHFRRFLSSSRPLQKLESQYLDGVLWLRDNRDRRPERPAATPEDVHAATWPVRWFWKHQAHKVAELLGDTPTPRILEIGTLYGVGTCYFAALAAARGGSVTTIDTTAAGLNLPRAEDTLAATGLAATVLRHPRGFAGQFLAWSSAGALPTFDLVYIDDGHHFDAVCRDTALAAQLLAPGGLLIFDDVVNPSYPEVAEVWREVVTRDPRLTAFEAWEKWGLARRA